MSSLTAVSKKYSQTRILLERVQSTHDQWCKIILAPPVPHCRFQSPVDLSRSTHLPRIEADAAPVTMQGRVQAVQLAEAANSNLLFFALNAAFRSPLGFSKACR